MGQTHLERTVAKAQEVQNSALRFQRREPERKKEERDHDFQLRKYEMLLEDLAGFKDEAEKRVEAIQSAIDVAAQEANGFGLSWGKVGKALGMTQQGAHKRYASGAIQRHLEKFRARYPQ